MYSTLDLGMFPIVLYKVMNCYSINLCDDVPIQRVVSHRLPERFVAVSLLMSL